MKSNFYRILLKWCTVYGFTLTNPVLLKYLSCASFPLLVVGSQLYAMEQYALGVYIETGSSAVRMDMTVGKLLCRQGLVFFMQTHTSRAHICSFNGDVRLAGFLWGLEHFAGCCCRSHYFLVHLYSQLWWLERLLRIWKAVPTGNVYGYRDGDTKIHAFSFFIIK